MVTKMIPSLRNKPYGEKLARLNLFSHEKNRLLVKIIECFEFLKRFTKVDASNIFSIENTSRTRNNRVKLKRKQIQQDCTKFFSTKDVVWG